MGDIVERLFGDDPDEPGEACLPGSEIPRPGDWCATPPGRAAIRWLGVGATARVKMRRGESRRNVRDKKSS